MRRWKMQIFTQTMAFCCLQLCHSRNRYILEDVELADAAKALWEAPFAVLAHDKFKSDEPVFTYANQVRHRDDALSRLQHSRIGMLLSEAVALRLGACARLCDIMCIF